MSKENEEVKPLDMTMVIMSRKRAEILSTHTDKFFPNAIICIAVEEYEDYAEIFGEDRLLVHPNEIIGTGPLRQWILDNVRSEIVVMIGDDISKVYSQVGFKKRRIEDPKSVAALVERCAIAAKDSGARLFGFAIGSIPFSYKPYKPFEPFNLCTWTDGVAGVIGRELRYDTTLKLREDIDFCLNTLMKDRYVYIDTRFLFAHDRFNLAGGNSAIRSEERHQDEMRYLKKKWKNHIKFRKVKGTYKSTLNIER